MANFYGTDIDNPINGGFDNYYGGNGNDALAGTAGPNELYGGQGNDLVMGTNASSTGLGTVASPFVYVTPLGPSGVDLLEGGSGDDIVCGFDGDDRIYGGDGNDAGIVSAAFGQVFAAGLYGGDGNDDLYGGDGNDLLEGGAGTDRQHGGRDSDTFRFNLITDSLTGPVRDVICDFSRSEHDKIDLSAIDAKAGPAGDQHFKFIGSNVFSDKAGELRFAHHKVTGDTDGDGHANFEIGVLGPSKMSRFDFDL